MAALSCFPFPYQSLSTLSLTLVSMPQLLYFFCIFDVILVLPRFVFWPHLVFHLIWFLNTHTSAQKPVAHTLSASKSILQHNNGLPGTDLLGSRTSQLGKQRVTVQPSSLQATSETTVTQSLGWLMPCNLSSPQHTLMCMNNCVALSRSLCLRV